MNAPLYCYDLLKEGQTVRVYPTRKQRGKEHSRFGRIAERITASNGDVLVYTEFIEPPFNTFPGRWDCIPAEYLSLYAAWPLDLVEFLNGDVVEYETVPEVPDESWVNQ